MSHLSQPPYTLAHGDYRLDNMFFEQSQFALCDWQLVCRARGPYDLAYFTTQSLNVEHRRAWEHDLLARYHAVLRENGVTNYGVDDLNDDYRVATLFCLVYPVIAGGSLTVADDRHLTLCRSIFERCIAAIADLHCFDLVDRFASP
jgi:thiamine kinase-like enzyme